MLKFFQDNKQEQEEIGYNFFDFMFRLKKVQNFCSKEEVDGILIITGYHGLNNESYIKLINWLFLGLSGTEVLENDFLRDQLCNAIFLIKQDSVRIFISRDGLQEIQKLVYGIPNVHVFCPKEEEQYDENLCENVKLNFLLQEMTGIQKVGVMLGKKDGNNVKRIEKWPLIQGYGLAELGRGFFSMQHQVVDLTSRLNNTIKTYDRHAFSQVIYGNSKRLSGHFNAAIESIGDIQQHKRQLITEMSVSEILQDTYDLEKLSKYVVEDLQFPQPRVLFGQRTNLDFSALSEDTMLKQIQENCFHSTFECSDLHSKVRAGRTYFLKNIVREETDVENILDDYDVVQEYKIKNVSNPFYQDEELLVNLYANLVISFQEIMQQVAKDQQNLNIPFVQQHVKERLDKILSSIDQQQLSLENDIQVHIKCYDAFGRDGPFQFDEPNTYKLTSLLFIVRIEVKNIKSVLDNDKILGSILFGESFLLQEGSYLLLTKDIPYIQFFNTDNTYSKKIQEIKKRIIYEPLGQQINEWDPKKNQYKMFEGNRMFIPTEKLTHFGIDIPIMKCDYMFHQKGLRIQSPQLGWILLYFKDMQNIMFSSLKNSNWMIFQLENNICLNALGRQTLCLEFTKNAVEDVMFKIRDYFDENQISYGYLEDKDVTYFENSNLGMKEILQKQDKKLIKLNQIYDKSFLLNFIQSRQNLRLSKFKEIKLGSFKNIQDLKENQVVDEKKVGIIFVNGSFNSGKKKFCKNLTNYPVSQDSRVFALDFNYNQLSQMDTKYFINSIIQLAKQNKATGGDVLICPVPHWISTQKVVDYLGKNEKLSNIFMVRSVITKINVNNFFLNENCQLVEQVMNFVIQGYSQAVVLDHYDNSEEQIQNIANIIKSANPQQKIYRIMGNIVKQGMAQEIIEQSKYFNEFNTYNRQQLKVLNENVFIKDYKVVFIPFKLPIDQIKLYNVVFKNLFQKKRGCLWKDVELEDRMKAIKESYKDSTDELAQDLIQVKEFMKISDLEKQRSQIDYIKGLIRFDNKLKGGVFEVTLNQNYMSQKKQNHIQSNVQEDEISIWNGEKLKVEKVEYSGLNKGNFNEDQFGFMFCGYNLQEKELREMLELLWRDQEQKKDLIKKDSFSHEQKKNIQSMDDYKDWSFGSGNFFDGALYRDENGLPLKYHPKIEEILDDYVGKQNQDIKNYNSQIQERYTKTREYYDQIYIRN